MKKPLQNFTKLSIILLIYLFLKQKYSITTLQYGLTKTLEILLSKKKLAHKKFKLISSHDNYLEFSCLRKECKILISYSYSQHIFNIENNIQTNIKHFWNYIKSLKKSGCNVPEAIKYNNITSTNTQENVQLFADFFSSVFESDLSNLIVPNQLPSIPSIIFLI